MTRRPQRFGIRSDKLTDFLNANNQPLVGQKPHPTQDYRRVLGDPRTVVSAPLEPLTAAASQQFRSTDGHS